MKVLRGGSRTVTAFKMERFVMIGNGWKPLANMTKRSILNAAAVQDPPLALIHPSKRHAVTLRAVTLMLLLQGSLCNECNHAQWMSNLNLHFSFNGSLEFHRMIDIFSKILRKLQYYFAESVNKLFQNVEKTCKISETPLSSRLKNDKHQRDIKIYINTLGWVLSNISFKGIS